jgi:hypothetical protein
MGMSVFDLQRDRFGSCAPEAKRLTDNLFCRQENNEDAMCKKEGGYRD